MRISGLLAMVVLGVTPWLGGAMYAPPATAATPPQSVQQKVPDDQNLKSADTAALDNVRTAFQARFGVQASDVRTTPVAGLYEVQIGMDLIYVDEDVNYVFQGALIDAQTRTDLTAARIQKLSEVPFESLPLDLAVKTVKGDGSHKLAVFEDPNCIYCKQLHASLSDIDDITLYSFLFPILSPDSVQKAHDIWCAPDSSTALRNWMLEGTEPARAQCSDDPVEQVLELGRTLMVRGTPALFFADGGRASGALPADQLKLRLDRAR